MSDNSLPWSDIVSFFHEITKFTDEKFFDLYGSQFAFVSDGEKLFERFNDKFEVNKNQFERGTFLEKYLKSYYSGDEIQAYLGIFPVKKFGGKSTCLLFTPVKFFIDMDEEIYTLEPENSSWSSTPELNSLLRDSGFSSDSILSLQDELDKFQEYSKIKNFLEQKLQNDINTSLFSDSRAIFFCEHTSKQSYNVNLYKDYDSLKTILKNNPESIGGFKLLEDYFFKNKVNTERNIEGVQRIIPLNNEQEQVVASALDKRSMTVVKGPPGCGKSQVVLSTIMNAWAQGKSVLFASNNNEAVDVVVQRLMKYQESFPITVRAGSSKKSTLKENLLKILSLDESTLEDERQQIKRIAEANIKNRNILKKLLDEGKPQAIFEQLNMLEELLDKVETENNDFESYWNKLIRRINVDDQRIYENSEVSIERIKFDIEDLASDKTFVNLETYTASINEDIGNLANLNLNIKKQIEQDSLYKQKIVFLQNQLNIKSDFDTVVSSTFPKELEEIFAWFLAIFKKIIEINFSSENLAALNCQSGLLSEIKTKEKTESYIRELLDIRNAIQELKIQNVHRIEEIQSYVFRRNKLKNILEEKKITFNDSIDIKVCRNWMQITQDLDLAELESKIVNKVVLKLKKSIYKKRIYTYLKEYISLLLDKENFTDTKILEDFIEKAIVQIIEYYDFEEENKEIKKEFKILEKEVTNLNNRLLTLPGMTMKLDSDLVNVEDVLKMNSNIESEYLRILNYYISSAKRVCLEGLFKEITTYSEKQVSLTVMSEIFSNYLGVKIETYFNSTVEILETLEVVRRLSDSLDSSLLKKILQLEKLCNEYNENEVKLKEYKKDFESITKKTLSNLPKDFAVIEKEDIGMGTIKEFLTYLESNKKILGELLNDYKVKSVVHEQELEIFSDRIEKQKQGLLNEIGDFETKEDLRIEKISINDIGSGLSSINKAKDLYNPENLEQKIALIDQSLSEQIFLEAKEKWYQKILQDRELRLSIQKLLDTYRQRISINESSYECFKDSLRAIPVWTTTMQSAQSIPLIENLFDILIVDEATQCSLNNFLPLMYRAKSVMVLGDKDQLEAITDDIDQVVENSLISKYRLSKYSSFFNYRGKNVYDFIKDISSLWGGSEIMLREHYRSHPLIIGFSNKYIYGDKLEMRRDPSLITRAEVGVIGYDIKGKAISEGKSYRNVEEAKAIIDKVEELLVLPDSQSIGIVTPYRKQADLIEKMLQEQGLPPLLVGTAHKFQGNERDIMLYSTVVTSGMDSQWAQNKNLVNVAVTRARDTLYLFSNFTDILSFPDMRVGEQGIIKSLIYYAKDIEKLQKTDPKALELYSWLILRNWKINIRQVNPVVLEISKSHTEQAIVCVIGSESMITSFDDSIDLKSGSKVERILSDSITNEKFTIIRRLANLNKEEITFDEYKFQI